MTKFAETAPQKLRTEAATTTAVVDCTALMMEPIDKERMNWARKTMLEIVQNIFTGLLSNDVN